LLVEGFRLTEEPPEVILDFVAGDTQEPRLQSRFPPELPKVLPGRKKCLLKKLVQTVRLGEETRAQIAVDGIRKALHKLRGRFAILAQDCCDQAFVLRCERRLAYARNHALFRHTQGFCSTPRSRTTWQFPP